MKSLQSLMNKNVQVISAFSDNFVALFVLIIVVLSVLLGISALNPSGFFTASSASANATTALVDNTTRVASNFSQSLPVLGTIFGVVLLLAVLVILVAYAMRMKNLGSGSSGAGL